MIVVDTGPIVAAALSRDHHHRPCVDLFAAAHLAGERLIVPSPIVSEVCYFLGHVAGPRVEAGFTTALADEDFEVAELGRADWRRVTELVLQYADLPLGAVDASVIAVSERLGATDVATLDRRHFSVVRPRHVTALTLLPELP